MDWIVPLFGILGSVLLLMAIGVPVAFAFFIVTAGGVFVFQGGGMAFQQFVLNMSSSVSSFSLVPIPLFIFMGAVLWHTKLGQQAVDALEKWLGRVPGRLSLLSVGSGTVFSALSGSTMANTAMLGSLLMPEMRRRGYSKALSAGPIMASGGLAMMIPPSALAVILASIGKISVAKVLVAAIIPGIMMAVAYAAYIVVRAWLRPEEAPAYEVAATTWRDRIVSLVRDLLPLGLIVFAVTGLIVVGVATPTESAALGALSSVLLAAFYGRLSFDLLRKALLDSLGVTVMTFAIMAAATGFSQILAFSGATRGLLETVLGFDVSPLMLVIGMQIVVLILGCFMEQIAIMLITLPIFIPIVIGLALDPVWFAIIMLVNLETALMTPPFGLLLFVMKGVAPKDVSFTDLYWSALPFILCNILVMALLIAFPQLVTFTVSSIR
jgi:tripartite ATP-independent transporter DctM subunit